MVMAHSYGQMDLNTKGIGVEIRPTVKENQCMPTVTFMKVNGLMIKLMEKELILMQMVPIIMVIGQMISNMDSVWNHGQTELSMKETIQTVRKKERESLHLPMGVTMRVNSNKMKFVDMETITGLMVNNMKENGVTIKCTEKEL